jgi:hypothetical protein
LQAVSALIAFQKKQIHTMNTRINNNPQDIDLTISIMQAMLPDAVKQARKITNNIIRQYPHDMTMQLARDIWTFLKKEIKYKADPIGQELIRSPEASWKVRKSGIDCEDYSLMIAAICQNLNIKCRYRIVDFNSMGWSHIYVIATNKIGREFIIDPVHEKFNYGDSFVKFEDFEVVGKSAKQLNGLELPMLPFEKSSLGSLPKDLWTYREKMILLIWDDMLRKGSKVIKQTRHLQEKRLYAGIEQITARRSDASLVNTIPDELKYVNIEYYKQLSNGFITNGRIEEVEEKDSGQFRRKITLELFDQTRFSFVLEYAARLAEKIAGSSVLVLKREKNISESEKKIYEILIKLASKDDLRPAMTGVYFDKERQKIMVTNGHYLIIIDHKVTTEGIFNKAFEKIDQPPITYMAVVPTSEPIAQHKIHFDEVRNWVERTKKFIGKDYIPIAAFHLYENVVTGISIPNFLEELKVFKQLGFTHGTVSLNRENEVIKFEGGSDFGHVTALIMPAMIKWQSDNPNNKTDISIPYREVLELNIAYRDVNVNDKTLIGMWSFEEGNVFGGYKASKHFQDLNQKNKTATAQAQRIRILALKYKYQTA